MSPENLKVQELPAEHQDRRPKPQQDPLNIPKDLSSSLNAEQTQEESHSQQQSSNFVDHGAPTGVLVYERYYKQSVSRILTPLFFVSSMLAELFLRDGSLKKQLRHQLDSLFLSEKCFMVKLCGVASFTLL